MDSPEEKRQRRLANLKPFSSEYQPKKRGSRKGIPNRSTVLKLIMKKVEKQERRRARLDAKIRPELD
jgi:hypothetical protein